MSVERYRAVDLLVLAVLMCLLEGLIAFAVGYFPGEAYSLSVILPVTLIVIMRWGVFGLIHTVLGGIVYAVLYGGTDVSLIAVYALGNLGVALSLLLLRLAGREKVRISLWLTLAYCLIGWLGINLGKSIFLSLMFGETFIVIARQFFAADLLNLLAVFAVIWIARKQNGVFEWQYSFLIRQREEEKLKSEA